MYTEIKELVAFLAKYLLGKIPRRQVSLFCEQYANYLVAYYMPNWNTADPTKGESERMIRVRASANANEFEQQSATCPRLATAAKLVGIDLKEMLGFFPEGLLLYANPGHVFYRFSETAPSIQIWIGDKDADKNYNSLPASAQAVLIKTSAKNAHGLSGATEVPRFIYASHGRDQTRPRDTIADDPTLEELDTFVRLNIEPYTPAPNEHLAEGFKMFKFVPLSSVTYKAEEFALTRFGSHRQRPDHDVMKRIQQSAVLNKLGAGGVAKHGQPTPPIIQTIR